MNKQPRTQVFRLKKGCTMLKSDWKRHFGLREAGVYYALIILMLILGLVTHFAGRPAYLSATNLTNILYQASMVGMMGVAMTVILITGNFDLSVASVAALGAAVTVALAGPLGFWAAAGIALLSTIGVGVLNGTIVQVLGINAFIVTLGTLTAIRGLVLILTNGRSLLVSTPEAKAQMVAFEGGKVPMQMALLVIAVLLVVWFGSKLLRARSKGEAMPVSTPGGVVAGLVVAAIALMAGPELTVAKPVIYAGIYTVVVWAVLSFTTVGRRVYAVGGNPVAARLAGINVNAYKMAGFILASGTAGFAGILFASRLGAVNPTALQGAELTVIAAAILGGTSLFGGAGSVIKTLVGALLLFTLTNGFNILNLGANYQGVIEGTVVVAAAAIYTVGGNKRKKAAA
ncbi:ABC transporter permease [Celeribacter sp.]|uniref:ABC transporter permease n=1 Tax=Celeribacter sp. TaxID=1890673 RepID=UPI003A954791